jgi:phosphoribosylaminoimidazole carboxylase (NCAIR synthetase)
MLLLSLRHAKNRYPCGGGQLGRMLLQAAANYPAETYLMENDDECPAAHLCHHFTKGDIKDFDAVYNLAKVSMQLQSKLKM